jgi:hemerythrin-like domain-containing protein
MQQPTDRRSFLRHAGFAGFAAIAGALPQEKHTPAEKSEEEVTPVEDLAREHGLLNRVLLIYDELIRRVAAKREFDPKLLADSATVIRRFIEDYHERLEEEHLFPRFQKAGRLLELVSVLRQQHDAGRQLTTRILRLGEPGMLRAEVGRSELAALLGDFVRLYRPHEAREDTVLFPALREIVSHREYESLGERFEEKEHELFGEGGFQAVLNHVETIEKALGIYDLSQYIPRPAAR